MGTCLIIANQTLGGDELAEAITKRITAGKNHFHLFVPPKASTPTTSSPIRVTPQRSNSVGVADGHKLAQQRLSYGIDWLTDLGATVTGDIANDPDTVAAITDVIAAHDIDEIIISTLPTKLSKWLRQDLPSKIERNVEVPVITITAPGS
ncbi:hypothetical protein [Ilumatobacter sp.]|uniref:hypothetical protein n=1 Tax=Ilumatobacter sp. TaxID=1967498 RepID=UPI003752CFE2